MQHGSQLAHSTTVYDVVVHYVRKVMGVEFVVVEAAEEDDSAVSPSRGGGATIPSKFMDAPNARNSANWSAKQSTCWAVVVLFPVATAAPAPPAAAAVDEDTTDVTDANKGRE